MPAKHYLSLGITVVLGCAQPKMVSLNAPNDTTNGDKSTEIQQTSEEMGIENHDDDIAVEALATCDQGQVERITKTITMPAHVATCTWSVGDNLPATHGSIQARYEDYVDLTMPKNVTICSMALKLESSDYYFDDAMHITLNNNLLFASDFYKNFPVNNGAPQFDWLKLRGYRDSDGVSFCYGVDQASACVVPPSQILGPLKLSYSAAAISHFVDLNSKTPAKLGVIISGDGDVTDCTHSEVNITIEAEVIKAQ